LGYKVLLSPPFKTYLPIKDYNGLLTPSRLFLPLTNPWKTMLNEFALPPERIGEKLNVSGR
jgi:hypothetical protein